MTYTFEKVADLEYDELTSLYLIETDELLNELFVEKIKTPFNLLYKFIKDGDELLSTETKDYIFELFDKIISTRSNLAERYQHLQTTDYVNQKLINKGVIENLEATPVAIPVVEKEPTNVVVKPKKEKELPRRYGAIRVIKDIEKNGGKATPAQRASLNNNELKNLYVKIDKQLIKKMLSSDNNLSDEDCRKISKAINTFKQQIKTIIKK